VGQTNTIAIALVAAFAIYITVRGELPSYLAVVGLGGASKAQ
jgi:hypothetical protein